MEPTQASATATSAIPRQFYCPITHSVMLNPVTAPDGMSYERSAWQDFERTSVGLLRSPLTRRVLPRHRALPNEQLRTLIRECPAAASELVERELEERQWAPKADRNQQLLYAARVGSGAVAGMFCSTLFGVVTGWTIGETFSTLDPARLFGVEPRNHERGFHFAQRGAQIGSVYGMALARRILKGEDTNAQALDRAGRQVIGLYAGAFAGGVIGLMFGGLSWPLACFTLEMCDDHVFHSRQSIDAGRAMATVGVVLGICYGVYAAAEDWARVNRRRPLVRPRP